MAWDEGNHVMQDVRQRTDVRTGGGWGCAAEQVELVDRRAEEPVPRDPNATARLPDRRETPRNLRLWSIAPVDHPPPTI